MDGLSIAFLIASISVVVITILQQRSQSEEALKMRDEQIRQKDEIISELKGIITGGDSFFYVRPSKVANTPDMLFTIEFRGKYPIYDASISVEEFDLIKVGENNWKYHKASERIIPLGTVQPLNRKLLFQIQVPELQGNNQFGKKYFFSISTRNGVVEQDVYVRREGPHFSHAFKVVQMTPDYSDRPSNIGIGGIKRKIRHIDNAFPVVELDHLHGDSGWIADYEESSGATIQAPR